MRASGFQHYALLYDETNEFLAGTQGFIEGALEAGEPILVAVPGKKIGMLRSMLNGGAGLVEFLDMNRLGRNPGRIIPAVREWVDSQRASRCRFIGEPIWPGRSAAEVVEATRHEALINLAFADVNAAILCPYDTAGLDPSIVADAERTHPQMICRRHRFASEGFTDPLDLWQASDWPLPDAPPIAASLAFGFDLPELRHFTETHVRRAGMVDQRVRDLVLSVDEAATNALIHGGGAGELRIWRDGSNVVCEIVDSGHLGDPLTGRRRPAPDWPSGRGVWLMNQLCDLVELRPTGTGTVVRLHMELAA